MKLISDTQDEVNTDFDLLSFDKFVSILETLADEDHDDNVVILDEYRTEEMLA